MDSLRDFFKDVQAVWDNQFGYCLKLLTALLKTSFVELQPPPVGILLQKKRVTREKHAPHPSPDCCRQLGYPHHSTTSHEYSHVNLLLKVQQVHMHPLPFTQ